MNGNEIKYVLPKLWVQLIGLSTDLHDFLIIWAIGSILGVTKDVDMVFTRKHDICRMQVMVMDPNLIPQYINIVIGDYMYEIQFRVEVNVDDNNPQPMDMDHNHQDGDDDQQLDGMEDKGHNNTNSVPTGQKEEGSNKENGSAAAAGQSAGKTNKR